MSITVFINTAIYLLGLSVVFFILLVAGIGILHHMGLVPKDWLDS